MFKILTSFNLILLILLSLFLFSCNENRQYFNTSKDAIKDIKARFPTLVYSSNKNIKDVSKRKISFENDSIEINLIEFEGDEDQNKILVFKNKENHYYSIPIFSTIHRDYWNFKNDCILKQFPKVNSTFNKEFSQMMEILEFKDDYFSIIYLETFKNLLQWDFIESRDELKSKYKTINLQNYSLIENENSEKASERIKKNIQDLIISYKTYQTDVVYGNGMILEFVNNDEFIRNKKPLLINCYRQDMNLKLIYL